MERAMLWFKCAAMHDPVRPVIKHPVVIGWEAKQRQIDLVIERSFKGEELLRRMQGWFTVDVIRRSILFNNTENSKCWMIMNWWSRPETRLKWRLYPRSWPRFLARKRGWSRLPKHCWHNPSLN